VSLNSPTDGNWNTSKTVNFDFNASDNYVVRNCSVWHNDATWGEQQSNTSDITNGSNNQIQTTFTNDGNFSWNVLCLDMSNRSAFAAANYTIKIDSTYPQIIIENPTNTSYANNDVWMNVTMVEIHKDKCYYDLDGTNYTLTNSSGKWNNYSTDLAHGLHNVIFWCNDSAGNLNHSSTVYFTVNHCVCGETITTSCTLYEDISTTGTCITFGANNIYLNCSGHLIDGDDGSGDYGVYSASRTSVEVRDCNFTDFG
ncbi:unnamed protein product, partial [marine sediment metagenome]